MVVGYRFFGRVFMENHFVRDIGIALLNKIPKYCEILRQHHVNVPRAKTLADFEEYDTFNVMNKEEDGSAKIFENWLAKSDLQVLKTGLITVACPPLEEGVLKCYSNGQFYVYWKLADVSQDGFRVSIEYYSIEQGEAWLNGYCTFSSYEVNNLFENLEFNTFIDIMRQVNNPKYINKSERQMLNFMMNPIADAEDIMKQNCLAGVKWFLVAMDLFNHLLDTENEERIPTESEHLSIKKYKFEGPKGKKKRIIYLGDVKIECARNNSGIAIRRGQIVRKTDCWTVRGHYRHYQNGNVVYIAPYEKGENRNTGKKKQGREYKLRDS